MNNLIKNIFKSYAPKIVLQQLKKIQYKIWQKNGCPVPPPHIVKQATISEYQKKYNHRVFIETGTYIGDMVELQKEKFEKVISIELDRDLFLKAQSRFSGDDNVLIVQGDSGKVLPEILKDIDQPIIFWLDGHYSAGVTAKGEKECPIVEELDAILNNHPYKNILLIDDARCFTGEHDYPTIEELEKYIKSKNEKYQMEIKHDIIRCAC